MAVYTEDAHITRVAGADLSAAQYTIVKLNSSRQVVQATAATDVLLGVLANAPKQNSNADVVARNADGTFKVKAGGTIAINDALTTNGSGLAITTTTAGNQVIGYAQEAGVVGQVIEYLPVPIKY